MKKWLDWMAVCIASAWVCASGAAYDLPAHGSAVVGSDEHIESMHQDTLLDIARRYSLGYKYGLQRSCKVAGKLWSAFSRASPCRVHERNVHNHAENKSSSLWDTTLAFHVMFNRGQRLR